MGKFNTKAAGATKTVNLAGGEAYTMSPQMELISILFTSFVEDKYYESAGAELSRLQNLMEQCDPEFVAKAAIYARDKYGMRSITHVAASVLAPKLGGTKWAKFFYNQIVVRPDDMLEIVAHYKANGNDSLPNAMKKGFAFALGRMDSYQLAKYKGESRKVKLVDIVNSVHPKRTEKNGTVPVAKEVYWKALTPAMRKKQGILKKDLPETVEVPTMEALVLGLLKEHKTWNTEMTKAGQEAKTEAEKAASKAEVWRAQIEGKKIGYFALLKNLRNIITQAPAMVTKACEALTNAKFQAGSRVLPFRYVSAIREIEQVSEDGAREVIVALNKAVDISLQNVPKFDGKTLCVIDMSGSMNDTVAGGNMSCRSVASLFSAIMAKSNNADMMIFGTTAAMVQYNPDDTTLTIVKQLDGMNKSSWYGASNSIPYAVGHGTNFHVIFETAKKAYDRIIIFSDMQGWIGQGTPHQSKTDYIKRTGADPIIYSFDLRGYGTLQFPAHNTCALAGFSDKVFDTMKFLEEDKKAVIKDIEKLEWAPFDAELVS